MGLQQTTVEYEIPGSIDGTTPAPAFSFDPKSPDYKAPDADGIVKFSAAEMLALTGGNFGLFDPDFGVGGTFADRFLHLVEVRTGGGGAAAQIVVVDARDPALSAQEEILAPSPEDDFYRRQCVFVPQGSAVAFSGFNPVVGQPVIVRISVMAWGSVEDYASLLSECCCQNEAPPEAGCCPPQVLDALLPIGQDPEQTLSLPGCGLTEPMTAQIFTDPRNPPATGLPTVVSVTVTQGTAPAPDTVDLVLDTSDTSGDYILQLTNGCGCCTVSPFSVSLV